MTTSEAVEMATECVTELCKFQTMIDEGNQHEKMVGRAAMESVVEQLVELDLLDIMITIAARQQTEA